MHQKLLHVSAIQLEPVQFKDEPSPESHLFVLSVTYRFSGAKQRYNYVYVPPQLEYVLKTQTVRAIQVVVMPGGWLMHRLIHGSPDWLVEGLITSNDAPVAALPDSIARARHWLLLSGATGTLCGLALLVGGHPWFGAFACVAGTQALVSGLRLPKLAKLRLLVPAFAGLEAQPEAQAHSGQSA